MKVQFYVKQINEVQKIRFQFLFSDEYAEMKTHQQVQHGGVRYQVESLEWMNNKTLKAICLEVKLN